MKTSKKWFIAIGLAAGSVLLDALLMLPRGYNATLSGICALLVFGAYTYCMLRYIKGIKPWVIVSAIVFGLLALHLPMRLSNWQESVGSLPDAIMHIIGIGLGYGFWRTCKKVKLFVILPLTIAILIGWIYFTPAYFRCLDQKAGRTTQVITQQPTTAESIDTRNTI